MWCSNLPGVVITISDKLTYPEPLKFSNNSYIKQNSSEKHSHTCMLKFLRNNYEYLLETSIFFSSAAVWVPTMEQTCLWIRPLICLTN